MEIKQSVESVIDFSREMFFAGKLAVASVLDKVDTKLANAINCKEDEY